jgi:hypothetical protein
MYQLGLCCVSFTQFKESRIDVGDSVPFSRVVRSGLLYIKGRATLALLIDKTNLLVSVLCMPEYAIPNLIGKVALMIISPLPTSLRIRVNASMLSLFSVIADDYTNHYSKL